VVLSVDKGVVGVVVRPVTLRCRDGGAWRRGGTGSGGSLDCGCTVGTVCKWSVWLMESRARDSGLAGFAGEGWVEMQLFIGVYYPSSDKTYSRSVGSACVKAEMTERWSAPKRVCLT